MMSKLNSACKSFITSRTRNNRLESPAKQQVQSRPKALSPSKRVGIDISGRSIEVIVKTKGRKSGSAMVSSRQNALPAAPKVTEDSHANNWSKTLRDQNRPVIKQGVQQLAVNMQSSKHSRHEDRREIKTTMERNKSPKYSRQDNRILDEIPVRQPARKSQEQLSKTSMSSGVPSTATIHTTSSMESVEVSDRGVQCGGIFDRMNDRFSSFNPVRTIGFLMKEMESLMTDEKSSKILTEMEQALLRIDPVDSGKVAPATLTLRSQLDVMTAKLAESSAKIESTCAAQREEIETLLQQVNRQTLMLEDAKNREKNLESEVKKMKIELNVAIKNAADSRRTISQLQMENKSTEVTEKLVTELRRELNDQIELAQQRFMEGQYLQLEKEKLMALSTYKDSKLVELRKTLQELQTYISEQLVDIREAGKRAKEVLTDNRVSFVQSGAASSSATSSCSINSIIPPSCPEPSDLSLSTVDCFVNLPSPQIEKTLSVTRLPASYFNGLDDSETDRLCDKTQLEFISLPGGEISHPISLSQRKDEEATAFASQNKNEESTNNDRKVEGFHSVPDFGGRQPRDSFHRVETRDSNKTARPKSKTRKSSSTEKKRPSDTKIASNREDTKKNNVDQASGDPASIKQQFHILFEDIRQQGKFPVHVPSPPRSYPRPDWSDNSLNTISGISETNII